MTRGIIELPERDQSSFLKERRVSRPENYCQRASTVYQESLTPLHFSCKALEKESGETQTRTGDTMIFSGVICVYHCSWLFKNSCKSVRYTQRLLLVVCHCSWRVGVVGVHHIQFMGARLTVGQNVLGASTRGLSSAFGSTRTPDPRIRSSLLCPAELRARVKNVLQRSTVCGVQPTSHVPSVSTT
jgi:hypothetical protein